MACNSDYMNATKFEENFSQVLLLLDELDTGTFVNPHCSDWQGYDERVYTINHEKNELDIRVEELCSKLLKTDVSKCSLEMQLWWREHQRADVERIEEEAKQEEDEKLKEQALNKLTKKEREVLGV